MKNLTLLMVLLFVLPYALADSNDSSCSVNLTTLEAKINSLQGQIGVLQSQITNLTSVNMAATSNLSKPSSQNLNLSSVESKIINLQVQIASLNNDTSSFRQEILSLNNSLDNIQLSLSGMNNILQSAKSTIDEFPSPQRIISIIPLALVGLGLIASVFLGLGIFNAIQLKKLSKKPKLTAEQKNKITSYISFYRSRNYPANSIKQGLLHQGWTEKQIEEAMGSA